MGKEADLLKYVKNNDLDKVQKVLAPVRRASAPAYWGRKDNDPMKQERFWLLKPGPVKQVTHLNINCREDDTGYTPLILAVLNGNYEMVTLLIYFSADVSAHDSKGNTPLHLATFSGRSDIVELLLGCGAKVNAANNDLNTALHIVCQDGTTNKPVLMKLLEAQPEVTAKNKDGASPFDLAAQYDKIEAVSLLLDHDPVLRSSSRALIEACIRGYREVVRRMLDYGADPNSTDKGAIGLHEACRYLRYEVAELLVSYGADTEMVNSKGETPRSILSDYPKEKTEPFFQMFSEWKTKTKRRPKIYAHDNKDKETYPLLKNDCRWTRHHPAFSSIWKENNTHVNLLDGDLSKKWVIPSKGNAWVVFNLMRPFIITGIRIYGSDDDTMAKTCHLQKANGLDGDWGTVRIFTCEKKGSEDEVFGQPQDFHGFRETAQYWRLLIRDNFGGDSTELDGINFFGVDSAVVDFLDQIRLGSCLEALIQKGFNMKDDIVHITRSDIQQLVSSEEDRRTLLEAVENERQKVGLRRLSELDAVFDDLLKALEF